MLFKLKNNKGKEFQYSAHIENCRFTRQALYFVNGSGRKAYETYIDYEEDDVRVFAGEKELKGKRKDAILELAKQQVKGFYDKLIDEVKE